MIHVPAAEEDEPVANPTDPMTMTGFAEYAQRAQEAAQACGLTPCGFRFIKPERMERKAGTSDPLKRARLKEAKA